MSIPLRNPFYAQEAPLHHEGPARFSFSRIELLHLLVGVVALTAAFSFILSEEEAFLAVPTRTDLVAALVAVATGFVLHELAHKLLAQSYGHWAEFRARFSGLALTVLVAALTKFLFAAPGAVLIQGRVTPREHGLISLVGPGLNIAVALGAGLPLLPAFSLDATATVPRILHVVAFVNALLGAFNLVPAGNLDGRKVWRWSRPAYAAALAAALGLCVGVLWAAGWP